MHNQILNMLFKAVAYSSIFFALSCYLLLSVYIALVVDVCRYSRLSRLNTDSSCTAKIIFAAFGTRTNNVRHA